MMEKTPITSPIFSVASFARTLSQTSPPLLRFAPGQSANGDVLQGSVTLTDTGRAGWKAGRTGLPPVASIVGLVACTCRATPPASGGGTRRGRRSPDPEPAARTTSSARLRESAPAPRSRCRRRAAPPVEPGPAPAHRHSADRLPDRDAPGSPGRSPRRLWSASAPSIADDGSNVNPKKTVNPATMSACW